MASPTKITKAVRARKRLKREKNRAKRVKSAVSERVLVLKTIEAAVTNTVKN